MASTIGAPSARIPRRRDRFARTLVTAIVGVAAVGLALLATEHVAPRSLFVSLVLAALVILPAWLVLSANYAVTLGVLLLYLGLVDGVLKLKLNTPAAALGRDVLLYSIVFGACLRFLSTPRPLRLPPLTGYVAAFVVIALIQLLNPGTQTLQHGLAALRPHLEFVPLFFLGYAVMRDKRRLRGYLLLVCVVAAANGVAGLVQLDMTPEQLSRWGPGYAERVSGTGAVSPRTFDDRGIARVRPLALGSDSGFGGVVGVLAIPALLALLGAAPRRWAILIGGPLGIGIVLAVVTSQARSAVVAAVVALLAFFGLAAASRQRAIVLLGATAAVGLTVGTISVLTAGSNESRFRYNTIAPTRVVGTTLDYRGGVFAAIPDYATSFPLGKGLGFVGPAAGFGVTFDKAHALNGETQFTFMLVELGVAGLLIFGALQLRLLVLAPRLRRSNDPEARLLLAGCAAPLFALAASWIAGPISATSPTSPYLWFTAGILAFWLLSRDPGGAPV